jgi:glycosyltransferase involved in cell wall biosynthesis
VRILQIYNQQRSVHGGEEVVVHSTVELLRRHGFDVRLALKSSRGIETSAWRKAKAAGSGFYNPAARAEISRLIRDYRPDVLHAHNIFPNWSPSIFGAAKRAGVATVMSVHSQILTCPNWYHLRNNALCEECFGGREHRCVVNRCRGTYAESIVYAARSSFVRRSRILLRNVSVFITMSQFMRSRLAAAGIPDHRIVVVPNAAPLPPEPTAPERNRYIAFVGRLSPEKGIDLLLAVARSLPQIAFKCAGDGPMASAFAGQAPANLEWVGRLHGRELDRFYRGARAVIVPSIAYETFSMVSLESMSHGVPVIGSAIGAIPELVVPGTGLCFPPGDVKAAAECVARLSEDDQFSAALGKRARARAARYSEAQYVENLTGAYRLASETVRQAPIPSVEHHHAL